MKKQGGSFEPPAKGKVRLQSFHDRGNTHAAADAQRSKAGLLAGMLEFVEQRHKDAAAGSADRMAKRDRAAIDVDLGFIKAQLVRNRHGLRGKRLVGFDEVDLVQIHAGLLCALRTRGLPP